MKIYLIIVNLSILVIIEYVGCTFIKVPSDSSSSKILHLLLPNIAELLDDFKTPPLIIVGSNFVFEKMVANREVVVVLP